MAYRRARTLLGILSFLPLLSLSLLLWLSPIGGSDGEVTPIFVPILLVIVVGGSMLLGLVLVFYYLYLVVSNTEFSMLAKVVWVILLAGAGIITLPMFWMIYLRDRGHGSVSNAHTP